jgi:hypothetical protein
VLTLVPPSPQEASLATIPILQVRKLRSDGTWQMWKESQVRWWQTPQPYLKAGRTNRLGLQWEKVGGGQKQCGQFIPSTHHPLERSEMEEAGAAGTSSKQ